MSEVSVLACQVLGTTVQKILVVLEKEIRSHLEPLRESSFPFADRTAQTYGPSPLDLWTLKISGYRQALSPPTAET